MANSCLEKKKLGSAELSPYVRLLLESEELETADLIREALRQLSPELLERLVEATDIYDTPKLFTLLPQGPARLVMAALLKEAPPYEQNPQLVHDRLFYAVYAWNPEVFFAAAAKLQEPGLAPAGFTTEYSRFLDLLEDKKLLSKLYPKAKTKAKIDIRDLEALL